MPTDSTGIGLASRLTTQGQRSRHPNFPSPDTPRIAHATAESTNSHGDDVSLKDSGNHSDLVRRFLAANLAQHGAILAQAVETRDASVVFPILRHAGLDFVIFRYKQHDFPRHQLGQYLHLASGEDANRHQCHIGGATAARHRVSGETAVVGAFGNDDAGSASGSAYVFERNFGGTDNWGEVSKLTASDAAAIDQFGHSVSISGDAVVVGAYLDDDVWRASGSAYIFERDSGGIDNWGETQKLTASDPATDDRLGWFVTIGGDTVVVGAPQDDDSGGNSGSAYLFAAP